MSPSTSAQRRAPPRGREPERLVAGRARRTPRPAARSRREPVALSGPSSRQPPVDPRRRRPVRRRRRTTAGGSPAAASASSVPGSWPRPRSARRRARTAPSAPRRTPAAALPLWITAPSAAAGRSSACSAAASPASARPPRRRRASPPRTAAPVAVPRRRGVARRAPPATTRARRSGPTTTTGARQTGARVDVAVEVDDVGPLRALQLQQPLAGRLEVAPRIVHPLERADRSHASARRPRTRPGRALLRGRRRRPKVASTTSTPSGHPGQVDGRRSTRRPGCRRSSAPSSAPRRSGRARRHRHELLADAGRSRGARRGAAPRPASARPPQSSGGLTSRSRAPCRVQRSASKS